MTYEKARKDLETNQSLFQEGYLAEQQMRDLQPAELLAMRAIRLHAEQVAQKRPDTRRP